MDLEDGKRPSPPQQDQPNDPPPPSGTKQGGWRAVAFILANESFEKLASMSLIGNITTYLSTKYNMEGMVVVNVVNLWSGSTNITPLIGAFLADAYMGRFLTLLFGSFASFLGMGVIALTAGIHKLRPSECPAHTNCQHPQKWQLAVLFTGLGLLAVGAGGIRPCNIAFGADQFDTNTEKGRSQLKSFFNWWYFSFTIALAIAFTCVIYVQTEISWFWGFVIPTVCLAISITIFLLGSRTYIYNKPQGSVFLDMIKVMNAAYRKKQISHSSALEHTLYEPPPLNELESRSMVLVHTEKFKCLDKAAMIVDPNEVNSVGTAKDSWRLCSVQQVESLKCLIGILPLFLTGILCFQSMDLMTTLGILQVLQTKRKVWNFDIPPGWMGLVSMLSLAVWILIYESMYIPTMKKVSKKESRFSLILRIRIGILMSILCMLMAATAEIIRRKAALRNEAFQSPVSIALIFPQFVFSGLTEAFAAVSAMEFFNNQMPESMRSIAGSFFFLCLSMASYLNTIIINVTVKLSGVINGKSWLAGHDLNANRLDLIYFVFAGLGVLNFAYFHLFASHYAVDVHVQKRDQQPSLEPLSFDSGDTCKIKS